MTRRLKVLQVVECGGPGGTGNQVAALCNGLAESFDVTLVYACRKADPAAYRAQASGAKGAHYVPSLVREISPLDDARAFLALLRIFRRERPDVVHAHSSKAGFLGRLAARLTGVPKVFYTPHGYGFLQTDRSRPARALYWLLEKTVSWIGTIVAVSESEAAFARRLSWGRPPQVVHDAYLGGPPSPRTVHEGLRIGSCGRMAAARDTAAFVGLCQRLTDSRNGLRCVWIGGGEDEAKVRRDLANMNLLGSVEITGWLDAAEARRRLSGLDVLVHYSRWDALPNAVLEAMALGLPVVASDVPGCRDCVVHGQTGFLAKNEVELLEHCLKLVDDPALRRRLGEAGRLRVLGEFSFEKALARWRELFTSP